jgi:type II secretory ATPase GspE/PulE/Tfp pilus assembly ATPase PilB-like protein/DNA-binding response OmpR family regulator
MKSSEELLILTVDDDTVNRKIIERILTVAGYRSVGADSGPAALEILRETTPDLILLDVMMPGMDGYEVCSRLQQSPQTACIPVIFITGLGDRHDRAQGFSVGAVDYVTKPIQKLVLLAKVAEQLKTGERWKALSASGGQLKTAYIAGQFREFKNFFFDQLELSAEARARCANVSPAELYAALSTPDCAEERIARAIANFLKLPYLSHIDADEVQLDRLPAHFAKANLVVATERDGRSMIVLANPFDRELVASLGKISWQSQPLMLAITEPTNIRALFASGALTAEQSKTKKSRSVPATTSAMVDSATKFNDYKLTSAAGAVHVVTTRPNANGQVDNLSDVRLMSGESVMQLADRLITRSIADRASDIHIEPKGKETVVRFRIDGDMREIISLQKDTSLMMVSRLKAMGGMDIAERRRPQDGVCEMKVEGRTFKLRLATTSTPDGESLILRVLDPGAKAKPLEELGMTADQVEIMRAMASATQGLILIVGPTGSGKTTTIFSVLSQVDTRSRSLISVEDPVEDRLPFANQQQVNERAGITFESLLKSAMRQDPDILFLGEVRDSFSAKASMDFASTGHLTISTLHTSNATSAVFRLERLNVARSMMADSILGVVAQRLLKKLCPACKNVMSISQKEADRLGPFMQQLPPETAHPTGCSECNGSGFSGREGVYEVVRFDNELAEMVRGNKSAALIREIVFRRGDYLIAHHAAEKVAQLLFPVDDVYQKILAEESAQQKGAPAQIAVPAEPAAAPQVVATSTHNVTEKPAGAAKILLVEDDKSTQTLIRRHLESQGYGVTTADDGIDALMQLGRERFDLILSDINMPNLDGFKLLETKRQKQIDAPLILLTGDSDEASEIKGYEMGVADYLKKPIKKELLLLRVKKVLQQTT